MEAETGDGLLSKKENDMMVISCHNCEDQGARKDPHALNFALQFTLTHAVKSLTLTTGMVLMVLTLYSPRDNPFQIK